MIVKRYTYVHRETLGRVGRYVQGRIGWYLFGFIPLYIADL